MARRATFGVADYCLLVGVLVLSVFIGAYHALRGRMNQNNTELLLGGRQMKPVPVAISIGASFLSAILILGSPAELYAHGGEWIVMMISIPFVVPTVATLFLPIFYRCQLTSVFEYLKRRFDCSILHGACVLLNLVETLLYMGVALYAPSLGLSAVTDLSLATSILTTAAVGAFCTTIGGLKAVIWADVLQALTMMAGLLAITIKGALNSGGIENMFAIAAKHGRATVFNFNFDPWQRHNFWNLFFGAYVQWTCRMGLNQMAVQRYLSVSSFRSSQLACLLSGPAVMLPMAAGFLAGVAIFATYAECDPLKLGIIRRKDQIVPYFMLDQMSAVPGLPGLFVASIMSGAISTVTSGLSSLAAITWQDFLGNLNVLKNISEERKSYCTRLLSILYGGAAAGLAFAVSQLGGIMQVTIAIRSATMAPVMGVFCLGIFAPFANKKGALLGLLVSITINMWLGIGAYASGKKPAILPTSVAGCEGNATSPLGGTLTTSLNNGSTVAQPTQSRDLDDYLYGLSYILYSIVGSLVCIIVGSLTSILTGGEQNDVDESLMNPLACKLYKSLSRTNPDKVCQQELRESPSLRTTTGKEGDT